MTEKVFEFEHEHGCSTWGLPTETKRGFGWTAILGFGDRCIYAWGSGFFGGLSFSVVSTRMLSCEPAQSKDFPKTVKRMTQVGTIDVEKHSPLAFEVFDSESDDVHMEPYDPCCALTRTVSFDSLGNPTDYPVHFRRLAGWRVDWAHVDKAFRFSRALDGPWPKSSPVYESKDSVGTPVLLIGDPIRTIIAPMLEPEELMEAKDD